MWSKRAWLAIALTCLAAVLAARGLLPYLFPEDEQGRVSFSELMGMIGGTAAGLVLAMAAALVAAWEYPRARALIASAAVTVLIGFAVVLVLLRVSA